MVYDLLFSEFVVDVCELTGVTGNILNGSSNCDRSSVSPTSVSVLLDSDEELAEDDPDTASSPQLVGSSKSESPAQWAWRWVVCTGVGGIRHAKSK